MTDENKKSPKQRIIHRLCNMIRGQSMYVKEDKTLNTKEMLEQADVLLNLMKFINNYDENIKVLDKYWKEKHHKSKFQQDDAELDR